MTDLVFIDDGMPTTIQNGSQTMINFVKSYRTYNLIKDIFINRKTIPFNEEQICDNLCCYNNVFSKFVEVSDDELYDLSKELEPKT